MCVVCHECVVCVVCHECVCVLYVMSVCVLYVMTNLINVAINLITVTRAHTHIMHMSVPICTSSSRESVTH